MNAQQLEIANAAGRMTLQNLQNMLDFTLPRMKTAVFQTINLYRLEHANNKMAKAKEIDERISQASMEMLGQTMRDNKKQQRSGLEHAKRVEAIVADVISLAEESMALDKQNAEARREAEQILGSTMRGYREAISGLRKRLPEAATVSVAAA